MPDASTTPALHETAVREYLVWISDPSKLIDEALVAQLEQQVRTATDPLDKLKAISRLEQARAVDGERYKLNFIKYAKQWADANQITMTAFQEIGVDDTILRAAGIGLSTSAGRERRPATPSGRSSSRTIRSVSVGQIKAEVSAWVGEFTLADVVTKVGGSPMTVRKAVDDLLEAGVVHRLGPLQNHTGRGRAPIVYRVR